VLALSRLPGVNNGSCNVPEVLPSCLGSLCEVNHATRKRRSASGRPKEPTVRTVADDDLAYSNNPREPRFLYYELCRVGRDSPVFGSAENL
jgi:hypothetical protein